MTFAKPIKFKFRYLNDKGQETGFVRKKGSFDGETLRLADTAIPAIAILRANARNNRVLLVLAQPDGSIAPLGLAIAKSSIKALVPALVQSASARWSELHKEELVKQGRGDAFHAEICPNCKATIDLSDRPPTPQVFCVHCDSIITLAGDRPADESRYRLCDECGYYAQPKNFTAFYFYFLLVVYGFWYKQMHMCNTCMRGRAWRMLFGNLLFLVGVPVALTQLCRAYFGGSRLSKAYTGLDTGNALAKKGRADQAAQNYQRIEDQLVCCAGVRYNHGLALLAAKRVDEAAQQFEESLADCANYAPAYQVLCRCYESLGRSDDLCSLKRQWQDEEDDNAAPAAAAPAAHA